MGLIGLGAFIWAVRHDQFDDPQGNAERILMPEFPTQSQGANDDDMASHTQDEDARRGL
ncbi:cbb3-type cytochrome oxidase assembly protein CcoS [Roseovarius spongiae]|uniref:Cbb3-type cytochrome oxidase assembly protein CcoS n=2 Tax=Roseovarius spongiae TaxID=2320272 RepID=A0A3A8B739_9RHOB|nr:cbb3-type cytochrome oxidase assembly protein CcoS [Roseovarius spongiae]